MGYTENCLPAALARRGHDVHLISSRLNVYGNSPDYERNYASFLGPAEVPAGSSTVDGYTVHRLEYRIVGGYVALRGIRNLIQRLNPEVVHSTAVASLASYAIALSGSTRRFQFYTECHQHLSVVQPYLREPDGHRLRRALYWLTRTVPSSMVGRASKRCYAIAPDCAEVAERLYGVPPDRIEVQPLGTDTTLFHPVVSDDDVARREARRTELGYGRSDIVCLYTGRFTPEKNPLVLANAIEMLASDDPRFKGLFVGGGAQSDEIASSKNCKVIPFMPHSSLPDLYRMADIAVWPRQESMSMLDAAASGLPIVVSQSIGDGERVRDNGAFYREDDVDDMVAVLQSLREAGVRHRLGEMGRNLMMDRFSWDAIARKLESEYERDAK